MSTWQKRQRTGLILTLLLLLSPLLVQPSEAGSVSLGVSRSGMRSDLAVGDPSRTGKSPVSSEVAHLTATGGVAQDQFGIEVASSGDTIVVGANRADVGGSSDQGAAYVYDRHQGGMDAWGQVAHLTASGGGAEDQFGLAVAISDDLIIVGAPYNDVAGHSAQGSAYVYARHQGGPNAWGQVAHLTASDGDSGDNFGLWVGVSDETVIVGAPNDDVGSNLSQGSAYVYARQQGGPDAWGQVAHLTAADGAAADQFGWSVAISGDRVVVGAPNHHALGSELSRGSAFVYERHQGGPNAWGQVAHLAAADGADFDRFGAAVAIEGETVAVGAWASNSFQGAAYVYERQQGDAWGQVQKLVASDGATGDEFGLEVALSGERLIVGAPTSDVALSSDQGAAYVFARQQGGPNQWGQVEKLTASDGEAGDGFGVSVAIVGDLIALGAPQDDVGSNSDQGSVYLKRTLPLLDKHLYLPLVIGSPAPTP